MNLTFKETYPTYESWKEEVDSQIPSGNFTDAEDIIDQNELEDYYNEETDPSLMAELLEYEIEETN